MPSGVRLFRPDDAEALATLFRASVEQLGALGYTPSQVSAWAARGPGATLFLDRAAAGAWIWLVADPADQPVAYTLLEADGHLDHLYCHPRHARQGHAARLLAVAEEHARAMGLCRLYTEASEVARPSFERAEFRVVMRRDFEIAGTPIHNYSMEKRLEAPAASLR